MNDEQEIASSMCIMLLPDRALKAQRPHVEEIHLTVAYFGKFAPNSHEVTHVRRNLDSIAKVIGGPVPATANATGIFPDRDGRYAIVDMIDGIGTFYVRKVVESLYGKASGAYDSLDVKIDYTHGFTPHVTRFYAMPEDLTVDVLVPTEKIEFTFDAIGVWHGHNHYEVEL